MIALWKCVAVTEFCTFAITKYHALSESRATASMEAVLAS